jgi:hypothetical protein
VAVRLTSLLTALFLCPYAQAQGNGRCGAGKDLVVQALERAGPQSSTAEFMDALQLLKRASALCSDLGDAWYYRSLVEVKLGHAGLAKFAADQARLVGSEAQEQGLQPFDLATPLLVAARGVPMRSALPAAPTSAARPAQKWALVVGISRFSDRNVPSLNYTANDAQAFARLLLDPGIGQFRSENVHVLTDSQATTKAIKQELNWIARHAQTQDMVVIYVATHGFPRALDSVGGLNYLMTYDTEMGSAQQPDEDALFATAFPMVDLTTSVASRMQSLRTLVVLDTCYSGGAVHAGGRMMSPGLANAAPSEETLKRMSAGTGRMVFAASREDEQSLESATLKHGYFTYFLLKRLTDAKGAAPLSQIYASVAKDVSDQVAAEGLHQNPVMDRSSEEADFSLASAPGH